MLLFLYMCRLANQQRHQAHLPSLLPMPVMSQGDMMCHVNLFSHRRTVKLEARPIETILYTSTALSPKKVQKLDHWSLTPWYSGDPLISMTPHFW